MSLGQILLIEDDAAIASALERVLKAEGYEILAVGRGDEGMTLGRQREFDLVITDLKLPGLNGLELVRGLRSARPRTPVVLMTAHGTTETAIEAMKYGAYDYLVKPFEMKELIELAAKAVTSSRLMKQPVEFGSSETQHDAIVGRSRVMQTIYKQIGQVAAKPVPVLIRGETGTGKELIARAVYQHSDRASAPFIVVNCAAIPDSLLESELFGHERGAFTGAESRHIGRFEQAQGGTIFLDEIGELSPATQAKLLRVLQDSRFDRVGGSETVQVDVRIIAATNRDLEAAMKTKEFRSDLYYRLSVVVIPVPPLRERKEDIAELTQYFLRKYGPELGHTRPSIDRSALSLLETADWPGNVRELENAIRKALLQARGFTISEPHIRTALDGLALPRKVAGSLREQVAELLQAAQRGEATEIHHRLLKEAERELFSQAITLADGNQAKAARWLGVSRLTMREKLLQFGLHPAHEPERES
jgi:DNA-binding NtrC family response regulator